MFILMPMGGNRIQTPHEEQPEPICLGILHFLTPVEDFLEAPSDPRFCSPPPLSSSKVHFDKNVCRRSRRAMQTPTATSGRSSGSCLASSRGKLWSDSRLNVHNTTFGGESSPAQTALVGLHEHDGLQKLSHIGTKCVSLCLWVAMVYKHRLGSSLSTLKMIFELI